MASTSDIIGVGTCIYGGVMACVQHIPLKNKMDLLKTKLELLTSIASDKEEELRSAVSLGKRRKKEVDTWLKQVREIEAVVVEMDKKAARARMLKRLWWATRVDERTKEVEKLIEQGGFSDGLFLNVRETESLELPTDELVGRAFELNKRKILEWLRNDNVFKIGVHGMGGAGKTMLAKHIHNRLLKDGVTVHWITVSGECSIGKLQSDLAECLRVDLSHVKGDEIKRAARLSCALKGKKNVIILDDVWKNYSLEKVGIPVSADGCKLILTSRSPKLCHQMGCLNLINVVSLSEEEAWHLFEKNLLLRSLPRDVEGIAKRVARKCDGLPLGITVLSGSMRGVEDIHEWKDVLNKLEASRPVEPVVDEVFKVLKISYDRLDDETERQCFMHFALFPEDFVIGISELVQHFIDAGLLSDERSREAIVDRGHSVINKLLGVSLLKCCKMRRKDGVKMHDLVREMVIRMTKGRFMVLPGNRTREIRFEQWTEGLEKISLIQNRISEIPSGASPRCPKLIVLLLNGNNALRSIPAEFFKHMPSLQLLDLSFSSTVMLPSSIKDLAKLTALKLNHCWRLRDVPPLEKLVSLNMEGSILMTGATVSQSPHLQYLNLLRTKARMKASELKSLRKLEMVGCHFDEVREFEEYAEYLNGKDGCVRWYSVHLTGGEPWNTFAMWNDCFYSLEHGRRAAVLQVCRVDGNVVLPRGIQELYVVDLGCPRRSLTHLSSLPLTTFTELWRCRVERWSGMKCFISLDSSSSASSIPHGSGSGTILPALQTLELIDLPELCLVLEISEEGRGGHHASSVSGTAMLPPRGSMGTTVGLFPCLRWLAVRECPRIQKLLTAELLPSLVNLEYIEVVRCESMTEVVASEASEDDNAEVGAGNTRTRTRTRTTTLSSHLPKLRSLHLEKLPQLRRICGDRTIMLGDSIEEVKVIGCHMLQKIPLHLPEIDGRVSLPPLLRKITIKQSDFSWWESLPWDHNTAKELIRPPFLKVDEDTDDSEPESEFGSG